ncbi:MAG: exo-beta-N-acetylmuramidase NamZ domain-containing protein, partial [Terriglobia bacterium]
MRTSYIRSTVSLVLVAGLSLAAPGCRQREEAGPRVQVGVDVLVENALAPLQGKRVGLVTNQTGRAGDGRRTLDVLAEAAGVQLVAVFTPEHGLQGLFSGKLADTIDEGTGLRVYSLYGATRRPTAEMLEGLDVLVFDLQDAGVRYYTYPTTMAYAMEEAARRGVEFVVLDR